jgi:hypothetical protein
MFQFIQTLERRVLLSATADALRADQQVIDADAKDLKAELAAASKGVATELKTITADVKGSTNKTETATQLKTLKADGNALLVKLKKDTAALLKAGQGPSHKAVGQGVRVINSPSNVAQVTKLSTQITALSTALSDPLATLVADASSGGVPADLDALVASNPANTTLANDAAAAQASLNARLTTFVTAATKFSSDVTTLNTDLATLVPA